MTDDKDKPDAELPEAKADGPVGGELLAEARALRAELAQVQSGIAVGRREIAKRQVKDVFGRVETPQGFVEFTPIQGGPLFVPLSGGSGYLERLAGYPYLVRGVFFRRGGRAGSGTGSTGRGGAGRL